MKARVMALLLSVAVAFSGIPATSVSANPATLETVVETIETEESVETTTEETTESLVEETVETTETEERVEETTVEEEITTEETTVEETTVEEEITTEETTVEETTIEESVVEDLFVESTTEVVMEEIAADVKAVGSNGKEYDGVEYLSLATVSLLPADAQEAYYELCDNIADMYDNGIELSNVVIAADGEALRINYKVPVRTFSTEAVQSTFLPDENVELLESVEAISEEVSGVPFVELDTVMKNENYYKNQLSANAKKIYDAGKKSMVVGSDNTINVTFSGRFIPKYEPYDALSALINTYPNKFNWMDLGPYGGMSGSGTIYYGRSTKSVWKFTIERSSHYSLSLETQADAKVASLVTAAQSYAKTNYPDNHIYGIIKYFDKWICENNYYSSAGLDSSTSAAYFYCHSCYGILLKGYGVCESYALAMTRLLDAVGIRNMYIVGDAGGGHAWNYVEMPDGKWYLLDSTWNDSGAIDGAASAGSTGEYLLVPNDGWHTPEGRRFTIGKKFKYPKLATTSYALMDSEVALNTSELLLTPKKTKELKLVTKTNYFKEFDVTWASSNPEVATVNTKGKVTAVAPGKAVITCTVAGKSLTSTVYVYKWDKLTLSTSGTASATLPYVNQDTAFDSKDVQTVTVTLGNNTGSTLTAQQLAEKLKVKDPVVKSSNTKIATVESTYSGNTVTLKINPLKVGTAKITTSFNGKKATLTVKVSQQIDASWFDFSKIANVEYNGKAFKPKVTLSAVGKAVSPKPTFKVTYANNKNAGTATVTVTGTGSYGGTITKNFTIAQKDASAATFNKCTAAKTYNGKAQAAATTVKLGKTTLKAGVDYDVLYNESATVPTNVGTYTVTIKTKGNYKTTTLSALVTEKPATYEIKATSIKKVTVSCPTKIKTGKTLNYKVKIGKNALPTTDYTVSILDKDGNAVNDYTTPGKYKLVITVKGSNVLPTATKSNIVKSFTVTK